MSTVLQKQTSMSSDDASRASFTGMAGFVMAVVVGS